MWFLIGLVLGFFAGVGGMIGLGMLLVRRPNAATRRAVEGRR